MKMLFLILVILLSSCAQKPEVQKQNHRKNISKTNLTERTNETPTRTILAEASTPILDKSENRLSNIRAACSKINGITIDIGGEFSFNSIVGKRSKNTGYKEAPIIVDGQKESGIGGGVCQVSSTIYIAAKNGSLQITERHPHSEPVVYVPKGNDATVVYGTKDLKFINNTAFPLELTVWDDGEYLYARFTSVYR